jgi:hypothetical protein
MILSFCGEVYDFMNNLDSEIVELIEDGQEEKEENEKSKDKEYTIDLQSDVNHFLHSFKLKEETGFPIHSDMNHQAYQNLPYLPPEINKAKL